MRKLKIIMLTGALCWPVTGYAQTGPTAAYYPFVERSVAELPGTPAKNVQPAALAAPAAVTSIPVVNGAVEVQLTPLPAEAVEQAKPVQPLSLPLLPNNLPEAKVSATANVSANVAGTTALPPVTASTSVPLPMPEVLLQPAPIQQAYMPVPTPTPIPTPVLAQAPAAAIQVQQAYVPAPMPTPVPAPAPAISAQTNINTGVVSQPVPMPTGGNRDSGVTVSTQSVVTPAPVAFAANGQPEPASKPNPMGPAASATTGAVMPVSPTCTTCTTCCPQPCCPFKRTYSWCSDCFSNCYSSMYAWLTPNQCCDEKCHACDPCNSCDNGDSGVVIWMEGLWLKAKRNDAFATESVTTPNTTDVTTFGYDSHHEFAFRAGAGYVTKGNLVFTGLFTHYDDVAANESLLSDGTSSITYVGPGQANGRSGTEVDSRWALRFNTLDLMAGTVVSPTQCVDLIFTAGAKLAWIDQDYHTFIDGPVTDTREDLRSDFHGAGPRVGAEGRVYLLSWLALFGRGHASILIGRREDESIMQETSEFTEPAVSTVRYNRREVIPVLELATGVEASLLDGRMLLGGGYEYNYWHGLGDTSFSNSGTETKRADINLSGLYARVIFLW